MAIDKAIDSAALDAEMIEVANSIRSKGGTTASLVWPDGFKAAVNAIPASVPSGMNIKYLIPCRFTPPRSIDGLGFDSYTFTFKRENVNQIFSVDWTLQDQGDNTTAGYWMGHLFWAMSVTANYGSQNMLSVMYDAHGKAGNYVGSANQHNMAKTSLSASFTNKALKGTSASYTMLGQNYKGLLIIYDSTYTGLPIVDETKLSSFIECQYVTAGWTDSGGGNTGSLSSFIYNDSTMYYFESGMTWQEWIDSDYNTDGFTSAYSNSVGAWGEYVLDGDGEWVDYNYSSYVLVTDQIVANGDYGCMR